MAKRYAACMVYGDPKKATSYSTFDSIRECLEFLDSSYDRDARTVSVISDWSDERGVVNRMIAVCTRVGVGEWSGKNDSLREIIESFYFKGAK